MRITKQPLAKATIRNQPKARQDHLSGVRFGVGFGAVRRVAAEGADIGALERQWRDALFAKDEKRLRELIHPQFKLVGIRSTGTVAVGLEDWLVALRKMDLVSLEVRVMDSLRLGQVMVATVDAQWKLKFMGHAIDERVLLTDVWVKADDGWQVVRRHSSPVPAQVKIE